MGWTKQAIVAEAFGELALAGYEFDLTPEEMQTGLKRLDAMMATWEARGVRIGYAFPSSAETSDLGADSGIPEYANEPAYLNLAIRLAAAFGKQVGPDTRRAANEAFTVLLNDAAQPIEQQLPNTLSRGAGNKPWRNLGRQFFPIPSDSPLVNTQGGDLDVLPE